MLAVPSKDGIELARERVRDVLAWEQVRQILKSREDVDAVRLAQLDINLRAARSETASHIVMVYCIAWSEGRELVFGAGVVAVIAASFLLAVRLAEPSTTAAAAD